MMDVYGGYDPRDIPTYPIFEASRYLRIPVGTLRSWLLGRSYQVKGIKKFSKPLIELQNPSIKQLSFTNLVEAHVLRVMRLEYQIAFSKVRTALDFVERDFELPHPLVRAEFQTDGVNLFLDSGMLINASQAGQFAIRQTLENYLQRIELDEAGLAVKLFPLTRLREEEDPKAVVIDPRISFGRPVLVGTGIPTFILAERYKAGESIDELVEDYGCNRLQIEEAIRCELPLAA